MITEVEISPEARAAGCTATATPIPPFDPSDVGTAYRLSASVGTGCTFVRWYGEYEYIRHDSGTTTRKVFTSSSRNVYTDVGEFQDIKHYDSATGELEYEFRTLYLRAEFNLPVEDSAINLNLVSVPNGVGTLTGGGIKSGAVGSSVAYTVNAEETFAHLEYVFSHWIDDAGTRHNTKQFSKSFVLKEGYTTASPEQKTFTAYFRMTTGMILRSSSSELILRGKANRILRDE